MSLLLSHRIERLIDLLAERMDRNWSSCWILLQSSLHKQWLSRELLKRVPEQALCGLTILSWKEAIVRLQALPDWFELGCSLVQKIPTLPPLSEWISEGDQRLHTLVWRLSHQIREARCYGIEPATEWQKELNQEVLYPRKIPDQIHCFCLEELPWNILKAKELFIYAFSPCKMFWEDLCSDGERVFYVAKIKSEAIKKELEQFLRNTHPLLANWGRSLRKGLKQMESLPTMEAYEEKEPTTLLEQIQYDLLHLRTLEDAPLALKIDSSLSLIAAGASKLREVEFVKEQVVRLVNKGVSCSDILILAPDMGIYEPLLRVAFGNEFSLRIAPVESSSSLCRGILQLFKLMETNWEADDLLELFENPEFQQKQQFEEEEVRWLRRWMEEAHVRGGWSEERGSIPDFLLRMNLGLTYLLPEDQGPLRISTIDWGESEWFQQLCSLLIAIKNWADLLQLEKRTLRDWGEVLKKGIEQLFYVEGDELWPSFLRRIFTASLSHSETFSFSFLSSALEEHCRTTKESRSSALVETIECLSFLPGSLRPARAIFILGMDCEQFPRREEHSSLDWPGPDRSEQDRSLLLQLLFHARESLAISYCSRSEEDGAPIDLAMPIQELVQLLDQYYSVRLEPTSLSSRALNILTTEPTEIAKRAIQKVPWALSELLLLARNPWKYHLKRGCGIVLHREQLFSERNLQESILTPFQERRMIFQLLKGRSLEEMECSIGSLGEWNRSNLIAQCARWNTFFSQWGIDPKELKTLTCTGMLRGKIDFALPGTLFLSSDFTLEALLRQWPSFLASCSLTSSPGLIFSLKTGKSKRFELNVSQELSNWMEYACRARTSLSPLIAPWMNAFLKKERSEWLAMAEPTLCEGEDDAIRWVRDRFSPLPLDRMWEEWHAFLLEVCHALL